MNRQATIALLLIAVLLIVVLVLMNRDVLTVTPPEEPTLVPGSDVLVLFEEAQFDPVTSFTITDTQTDQRFSAALGETNWNVVETATEPEEGMVVDSIRLGTAANSLASLTSTRQLSQLENLANFGLESARYTLTFATVGGQQLTLAIGNIDPLDTHYYAQRPNDPSVHLVARFGLDLIIDLLEEPPYAEPTPTPEPTLEATPET